MARIRNRRIFANDEFEEGFDAGFDEGVDEDLAEGGVDVDPEATDLLFETEDVAELVAEVTGQDVAVEADGDAVTFTVGEDEFVVEAEGDEEILESRRIPRGKRRVSASTRRARARRVAASTRPTAKRPTTRRPVKASTRRVARRRTSR